MISLFGEAAAFSAALCWASSSMIFSNIGGKAGAQTVNRGRLACSIFCLTILHWILQGQPWPNAVTWEQLGWLSLSSVLGLVIGDAMLFQAFVLIGARLSMLLMSTVPIMGAVLAWVLFDETLRPIEITGIACGVGGVLIVILGKKGRPIGLEGRNYTIGILFGFGGAVGQVANLITAKYALIDGYSALSATWIRTLVAVIAMWGLAVILGRVRRTVTACIAPDVGKWLLLGALVGPAIGVWLSMLAVQNANVGIASTLMALPPVILIVYEGLILRKPVGIQAVIGTFLAFGGVTLLFMP
ncbi:DMT family transporter [Thalassospira sp. ER-Se-21-Dark]|uniref:DMT family transporter n=1 Tax=Thalassospira sp. ER-Se-21-Dark TaxID=2585190 RepID=UPI001B300EBD|nr:DMT family transporter [Thalassospira sp. ER-Se-21-Dark]MBP3127919.1 DMT family transporter [Thalassospira sp. ER-Se-21-Dark]